MTQFAETPTLRIAYEDGGPKDGPPVLLLHGWPDDPRTYDAVAPALQQAGFRTVVPYLRGFGPTTFHPAETVRSGEYVVMAQDALDFADALGLKTFSVVGHDWGARIAYVLAAVCPERVPRIAALSVGWAPGELATPALEQVRLYWYQWFMATERGRETVRSDPKAFARIMWETWAPQGWFSDAEFDATAKSFENEDWPGITLHSYTVRWGETAKDPRYADLDRRAMSAQSISVPTLMIQGGADGVTIPPTTEGKDKLFTGGYRRVVIDGVGHFPTRENPEAVNKLLLEFLKA
ncbi:MAG: alpha/beta hydrolase [Pseudolabrys sp.]|nr:alpha/beta hydrolase [Pseudolabrys sp.]